MKPLFSIVTPTFNRSYCLWKTIQSLQTQTLKNWELLIIDDESSDDTKKVVAEFQQDKRIKYYKIKHGGTSKARNYGIKISQGKIIGFLDSDDTYYSECLDTVAKYFTKNPSKKFAIPDWNFKLELYDKNFKLVESKKINPKEKPKITLRNIYHWKIKSAYGSGLFVKKEVLKGIKFSEDLKVFDDWEFVLQLGKQYPDGLLYIPHVLFEYSQRYGGDATCSNTTYLDWAKGFEAIYQKHKDDYLMKGQNWYPERVEKYKRLQKEFEEGKAIPPEYKYFSKYYQP